MRRAFEAANEIGDLTFAAYSCNHLITNLLAAGDPLAEVQREAEKGLEFAQKARFGLAIDIIARSSALIRTLRGLTPNFGSLRRCGSSMSFGSSTICEQPGSGARPSAGTGSASCRRASSPATMRRPSRPQSKAQRLLWHRPSHLRGGRVSLLRRALPRGVLRLRAAERATRSISRRWPRTTGSSRSGRRTARRTSRTAPRWSARRSPASKAGSSMPSGSTSRRSARRATNGSSTTRRSPTSSPRASTRRAASRQIAQLYLRNARYCYLRWGADGKVRQLDQLHPHLREEEPAPGPTSTIGAPVEHLDLATVIKVSQAVSGEIVLEKLIDTLMRTAIEQAGAERGLLILAARRRAADRGGSDDQRRHGRRAVCATSPSPRPRCRSRSSTMSCARGRA